jgi:hypothetical protein
MRSRTIVVLFVLTLILLITGCAPNNQMYFEKAAGFWAGVWHGLIVIITFIISLFTDTVGIYEINNTGGWYDFGFVLGLLISLSHGGFWCPMKSKKPKSPKEKEWDEIGVRVEEKVRTGIRKWLDEAEEKDPEWEEIGKKVEEKIKRELRNWAEK